MKILGNALLLIGLVFTIPILGMATLNAIEKTAHIKAHVGEHYDR